MQKKTVPTVPADSVVSGCLLLICPRVASTAADSRLFPSLIPHQESAAVTVRGVSYMQTVEDECLLFNIAVCFYTVRVGVVS